MSAAGISGTDDARPLALLHANPAHSAMRRMRHFVTAYTDAARASLWMVR